MKLGCKLPHGIILKGTSGQDIQINGMNTSLVLGGFGITNVSETEHAFLLATYSDHAAFKNNAVFSTESDSVADLADLAVDLKDEKTGFEGMNPEKPVPGVEPDPEAINVTKAKEEAANNPRPARAPRSKADKEAAKQLAGNA